MTSIPDTPDANSALPDQLVCYDSEVSHGSQKFEALGRLAETVAHDLNNLLLAIHGRVELALTSPLPDEVRSDLLEALHVADLATVLVARLRVNVPKAVVNPGPVDVNERVARMHRTLRGLVGESIQLEFTLSATDSQVQIAEGLIEQVVMNLVLNARDAMPRGGSLRIMTLTMGSPAKPMLMLAVADAGTGIASETQQRIFEPYFTTKAAPENVGLGLSIVAGIVHDANGKISVESRPGMGTAVRVLLPLSQTAPNS